MIYIYWIDIYIDIKRDVELKKMFLIIWLFMDNIYLNLKIDIIKFLYW